MLPNKDRILSFFLRWKNCFPLWNQHFDLQLTSLDILRSLPIIACIKIQSHGFQSIGSPSRCYHTRAHSCPLQLFPQMFSVSALPDISDDSLSCCWKQICYLPSNPFRGDQTSVSKMISVKQRHVFPAPSWLMQADFHAEAIAWRPDFDSQALMHMYCPKVPSALPYLPWMSLARTGAEMLSDF